MIYRATEGTVLSTRQELLDDNDEPIKCKAGYPKVALLDTDKQVLSSILANPGQVPGDWFANISIPNMSLSASGEFTVRWRAVDVQGQKYTIKDAVIVEPQIDSRETDVVALFGDLTVAFVLPTTLLSTDVATYQIYADNVPILAEPVNIQDTPQVQVDKSGVETTRVTIPLVVPKPSLFSSLLKVDVVRVGVAVPQTYLYKLWALTPQVFVTMTHLEDFLNKSRIDNVIPELRYTTGDLIGYLERGLNYFNMIEKPTFFNGMNMQGVLFDAHLICSSYYALSAQLMAEGSLAFDFSGQGISLNVDRTPALEGALGRIESQIDSRIIPLKKELVKNGLTGGDGSIGGGNMNNVYAKGLLSVMNAATTRISQPMSRFMGRRR
jgi:hypothetical protein